MPRPPGPGDPAERGLAAVGTVVAAALVLVLFVSATNAVVMVGTRHAVRMAVDEGSRAGGRADDPVPACEARAREVLAGLLGPDARRDVTVTCATDPDAGVRARAEAIVRPWWPGLPAWRFAFEAAAVREALP